MVFFAARVSFKGYVIFVEEFKGYEILVAKIKGYENILPVKGSENGLKGYESFVAKIKGYEKFWRIFKGYELF